MKRVGVVSFLGDAIELSEERILPFPGIVSAPFHVNSWCIDRYTRELVEGQIARHGSIFIVPFDYDHETLWKMNYDGPEIRDGRLRPILTSSLSEISRRNDLDSLVVVYGPPERFGAEPNQLLPFCLFRSFGFTGKGVTYHAYVRILVLDGKSMEPLGLKAFYHKEGLEASIWPPFTHAGQLMTLEKKTKDMLSREIPLTVKELGFEEVGNQGGSAWSK